MSTSSEVAKQEDVLVSLRNAATAVRTFADTEPAGQTFYRELADWFDAVADREQAHLEGSVAAGYAIGDPEPGDEIYGALALARAWLADA